MAQGKKTLLAALAAVGAIVLAVWSIATMM